MRLVSQTPPSAARGRATFNKLLRFMIAGGPMFAVAVPVNWLLVSKFGVNKPLAYGGVLLCQTTVNFFICRWFIFHEGQARPLWRRFAAFMPGMFAFRLADWMVYTLAVSVLGVPYLAMQIINVCVFSLLKFGFARRVMEA